MENEGVIDLDDQDGVSAALTTFQQEAAPEEPTITPPRPGVVELLYGAEIDGERYKIATVRELNGADEESLARLDSTKANYPVLLVDLIIRRGTVEIGGHNLKGRQDVLADMLMADRDLLFKEILFATYGSTKEYENVQCPECGFEHDIRIRVDEIVTTNGLPEEDVVTVSVTLRDGTVVTLHYPTGEDQMAVHQSDRVSSMAEQNTIMIARCLEDVDGDYPSNPTQWAKNLGMLDRRTLVGALANGPSVKFEEVEVPCENCGIKLPFVIGWADLLLL